MSESDDQKFLESTKFFFDTMKHLTTLSTGSILLMVAVLEKLFKSPHWKILIVLAFLGFTISILTSLRLMMFCVGHAGRGYEGPVMTGFYRTASYSFVAAIICFSVFVVRNLWP